MMTNFKIYSTKLNTLVGGKIFENNGETYSFTINELIEYFDEKNDFHDKTHKFLRDAILYKKIKIENKILIPLKLIYSPRSAPVFWIWVDYGSKGFEGRNGIGLSKNDIIYLYVNDISYEVKKILDNMYLYFDTKKYNL